MRYESECRLFIENRDLVKSVYKWESGLMYCCCSLLYTAKGELVNQKALENCRKLLKDNTGVFSDFRNSTSIPITAIMAESIDPEQVLIEGLKVYEKLKQEFHTSTYLPFVSVIIAEMAEPEAYDRLVERTKKLYQMMKDKHPFLTSGEDCVYCALLALSDKTDDDLIKGIEECYVLLKPEFSSRNAVQSLSHALALFDGSSEEKVEKTMTLFRALKAKGYKYGTNEELPALGVLAMTCDNTETVISDMIDIEQWLSKQKGFGTLSDISKKQRLMYAGILATTKKVDDKILATTVQSAITQLVAELIAMYCCTTSAVIASTMNH